MYKIYRKYYLLFMACCMGNFSQLMAQQNNNIFSPAFTNAVRDFIKELKTDTLFNHLHLGKLGMGRIAYDYAIIGYQILKAKGKLSNDNILSIVDFSLPSSKKRLFVLDIKNRKLLFVDYVAHGRNSGLEKALHFSNEPESFKSSVGFYTTLGTYTGKHGFSLRLEGHEIGFNSNALHRDIVIHSASYVDEAVVKSQGYLGRSLGCPALSVSIYKGVINDIKNGTCLFVYGNDSEYIKNSNLLKRPVKLEKKSFRFPKSEK